jgi:hypothetical protein
MLREAHEDRAEIKVEAVRTRTRLHELEGSVGMLLDIQNQARREEARQYRHVEVRIQVLTVVIGLAAVVVPIALLLLSGK